MSCGLSREPAPRRYRHSPLRPESRNHRSKRKDRQWSTVWSWESGMELQAGTTDLPNQALGEVGGSEDCKAEGLSNVCLQLGWIATIGSIFSKAPYWPYWEHGQWLDWDSASDSDFMHSYLRYHPNIVRLLGFGWGPSIDFNAVYPILVLEHASHGSLAALQASVPPLRFAVKQKLCHDVARGIAILHACGMCMVT